MLLAFILSGCATNAAAQLDSALNDGLHLLAQYDFKEAELKFEDITKMAPDSPVGYTGLLTARLLQNKAAAAKEAIEAGIKKVSTPEMNIIYANYLAAQGDTKNALASYEKAVAMDTATAADYAAYIRFMMKSGSDEGKIMAAMQQAAKRFPDDYTVQNLLCEYAAQANLDAALLKNSIGKSLQLQPGQYAVYETIAAACGSSEDPNAMLASISADPATKEMLTLAIAFDKARQKDKPDYAEFFNAYAKLTTQNKTSNAATAMFAAACADSKRKDEALKALEALKTDSITDARLLILLSGTYAKLGKADLALETAAQAIALDKWNIDGYIAKAKALTDKPEDSRMAAFRYIIMTGADPFEAISQFQAAGIQFAEKKVFGNARSPFSFNGIRIGDSKQKMIDIFGKPESSAQATNSVNGNTVHFYYYDFGSFGFDKNNKIDSVNIWDIGEMTDGKGIGLNSDLAAIRAAYGNDITIKKGEGILPNTGDTLIKIDQDVLVVDNMKRSYVYFSLVDDRVRAIQMYRH